MPRKQNLPSTFPSNSEYIVGRVSIKALDNKRKRRDSQPLDLVSVDHRWDTNNDEVVIRQTMGDYEEVAAGALDEVPTGENLWGRLVSALHHLRCVGPLVHIFLVCFFTLREVARSEMIIAQASGEELALILYGGRIANNTPEVSTDLGHVSRVKIAWHGG